jgi:hypothetical protein
MIPKKTSLALVALAAALPLSLPHAVQAGPLLGPGSEVRAESMIGTVVKKKSYHQDYWQGTQTPPADNPSAAPPSRSLTGKAVVRPGHCGTRKYWDKQANKCVDARDKRK